MAGRRPTPDQLKQLTGSHNKQNGRSPVFRSADAVKIPARVLADQYAKALWEEIVLDLVVNGLLTYANQAMFAEYCLAYAGLQHAHDAVAQDGRFIEVPIVNKKGDIIAYKRAVAPAVGLEMQYRMQMLRIAVEFGLTPAAQTRVEANPVDPGGAELDFLSGPPEEETNITVIQQPN